MTTNRLNLSRAEIEILRFTPFPDRGNGGASVGTISRLLHLGLIRKTHDQQLGDVWVRTDNGHDYLREIGQWREED